jgi:hypothetical protein
MAVATMARPKGKTGKPKTGNPSRKASYATVNLKGSDEWKAWVDELAIHCRTDIAKLIDRGLILVAKAEGFTKEAPPR